MIDITVSVVLYHTDKNEILNIINKIQKSDLAIHTYLVDNSKTNELQELVNSFNNITYIFNNANIGYGSAHNIAISDPKFNAKYHLVMNADIDFDPKMLRQAYDYLERNVEYSMVSPQIKTPDGKLQMFCRKLPTPFDLVARRFVPKVFKPMLKGMLSTYVLADKDYSKEMNVPNLPGCFMFIRKSVLLKVHGFDEKFFMYVEDVDLTRRLNDVGPTMYNPELLLMHGLARGSYKFSKLFIYHINSAVHYFNKWGWFNDKQREIINNRI